ncbi:MAG TPA: gamma carbonic anhydrase family protein, partial [Thermomicrobiales bacterium]|nr:gamma carbonic anhydrase family protein [Thermomicrobiales bacterium]
VSPSIADDVFIAPGAVVVGDVTIGKGSSIWFNVVLRGDVAPIRIGEGTNIQDLSLLHVDRNNPCIVGNNVTIGHSAIVHGTVIEDDVTIAMGAVVLSWTHIGKGAVIAAGAVVPERMVVEPGALMVGIPATLKTNLAPEKRAKLSSLAGLYVQNAQRFQATLAPADEEKK